MVSTITGIFFNPSSDFMILRNSVPFIFGMFKSSKMTDGLVLIAGGSGDGGVMADEYHPVNGGRPTSSMGTGRWNHTATLLPDGRVLVVGGLGLGVSLSSAEVYEQVAGAWYPGGPDPGEWSPAGDLSV